MTFPHFYLTKTPQTETPLTVTKTPNSSTTSTGSSSPSEIFSPLQQSLDSLRSLSNHLSDLTLARGKPRRGQFGYISETEDSIPSSPSTLSRTSSSLFEQQPHNQFTPATSPAPIPAHISDSSSDDEMAPTIFFWGDDRADDS